jgi:serine hydrolase
LTSFLIVHGWQNRQPEKHWQHWLAGQLRARGHQVLYPPLPDPDFPVPYEWVRTLRQQLTLMRHSQHVVICHSLGCMAWLHLAAADSRPHVVDRLLFVAPPSPDFLAGKAEITGFRPSGPLDPLLRATSRTQTRLVCSDNDPCCEQGAHNAYQDVFDIDFIRGEAHFDIDAGYGEWPSVLQWCEDPKTRITGRVQAAAMGRP